MAYFFITEDNKIFAGGYNSNGNTGTNTKSTSSTYKYSLFPPQEIIYETLDGTILDGSMIKTINCGNGGTLLLTTNGEVYVTGSQSITGLGKGTGDKLIFTKLEYDENENKIPKIDKVFIGSSSAFLLTSNGVVYSCGMYNGVSESTKYKYNIIEFDIEGNPLLPIVDISINNNFIAFLTNTGEVYSFGASSSYGIYDDDNFTSHAIYYPKKARVKNVAKVVATQYSTLCLDRFGELWCNGYTYQCAYTPFVGKYYDSNKYIPYTNFMKLDISELHMRYSDSTTKYAFPKKILDIYSISNVPIIKYLDEEGKINLLTTSGAQKYLGCGTTPNTNTYWYNVKNLAGFCDFKNTYIDRLYILDDNGIGCMSKDGNLYVAGGKGTVGGIADKFTAPVVLPGTEELTITRVFGYNGEPIQPTLKDELYPMPDISKAKVRIQNMM